MTEVYYSGDNMRHMSGMDAESIALLTAAFSWFRKEDYYSVSGQVSHEVLGENVITGGLPLLAASALAGPSCAIGTRKFCMTSRTSFLRICRVADGERPPWLPSSSTVLFKGENHEEYGRPFNEKAGTFHDLYFTGRPAEVEAAFGLPERRGKYETYYGATVKDGQPARIKQYLYDEQGGFSDWDVIWMMHKKSSNSPLWTKITP